MPKFICFGYLDTETWATLAESERLAMIDNCLAYDEVLRKNGNWAGGEGLQGPDKTVTLQHRKGKVSVTDGPYAETKELLGGLLILEARDLKQAIELMSNHPGVKMGRWEIRPAQDLGPMIEESARRRGVKA